MIAVVAGEIGRTSTNHLHTLCVNYWYRIVVVVIDITVSLRFGINPDNVATPLAASLGDLVTLALLVTSASTLQDLSNVSSDSKSLDFGPASIVLSFFLALLPLAAWVASKDPQTKLILKEGWTPGA